MNVQSRLARSVRIVVIVLVVLIVALFALRAFVAQRGPSLQLWHTFVPKELSAEQIDRADWNTYIKHENALFDQVRVQVSDRLPPAARIPSNRYFEGSPIYPGHFEHDWNRSYLLRPAGQPIGAVVLLHGLTDSPYSLRHIAQRYVADGFVAVGIRLPGHGTVPAGLSNVNWESWMAATRLAVREARRQAGPGRPIHLVGFSNGGALAMKYALDSLEDPHLDHPAHLILISPMIGVTRFARFAGLAALPALLPPFEKASWLGIVPEFNPFKYNSFPVNGARQSHRLTKALQEQLARLARERKLDDLAPVLTFQSVIDFTVSTQAIIQRLYANLPANGNELVLFDVNRRAKLGPLIDPASSQALARLLPTLSVNYRLTMVGNELTGPDEVIVRVIEPGTTEQKTSALGLKYPPQVFSLSHVAIPFPLDDELYGIQPPDTGNPRYGVSLGALAPRGERGALMVSLDSVFRISSNPFFPYLLARIDEVITEPARAANFPSGGERHSVKAPAQAKDPGFDDMERKALDIEQDPELIP
ncbi:alpha/beta hydrolase [Massilia horti]|uniref:Alpha/beta hydrolase n=1 Tax=Massilia horti TaxID=2562153 RepID=A0A4Y9T5Q5_9BURK|nr:alpha/beta hydrolase [Massilia horti]TFW32541.1 alpha/beta hydrolase [Massilia horti]